MYDLYIGIFKILIYDFINMFFIRIAMINQDGKRIKCMNKHSKVFDPNCEKILVSKKELQMLYKTIRDYEERMNLYELENKKYLKLLNKDSSISE